MSNFIDSHYLVPLVLGLSFVLSVAQERKEPSVPKFQGDEPREGGVPSAASLGCEDGRVT